MIHPPKKNHKTKKLLISIFLIGVLLSVSLFNIFGGGRTGAVTDTFNASGSWTAPAGVTSVTIQAWGGGGAGGGAQGNPSTGGGGAGGSFAVKVISVTPSTSYTVTVGTGGTGSTGNGGVGGDSWFNTSGTILAKGGAGGTAGTVNSTNGAGATGSCTGCIGDTSYAGGNGGTGNYTSGVEGSGAGGGAAGATGVGGNASINVAGTGTSGGGNGAAGVGNSTAGGTGSAPGGAGSGGKANNNTDRAGGAGAAGRLLVIYNLPPAAPTLSTPANSAINVSTTPTFTLRTTDADNDYLRYKIEVCSTNTCSSIIRTIDQTVSQTGWTGQDAQTNTAYVGNSVITSSTMASHTYQGPALSYNTQYWWRAYAIDAGGSNTLSGASSIFSFTTNQTPSAPTLSMPTDTSAEVSVTPQFQLRSSDADNDYLRYKIEVCSDSTCTTVLRTIDQTVSQTGWTGQDQQTATAYTGNSVITSSTMASHTYQSPALSYGTQYWWRAYAVDPGGTNTFSGASGIFTFTTVPPILNKLIQGGTQIRGGTRIGN